MAYTKKFSLETQVRKVLNEKKAKKERFLKELLQHARILVNLIKIQSRITESSSTEQLNVMEKILKIKSTVRLHIPVMQ
ncbi:hypothetical protein SNEBB_001857 [Seison nebaliae]|nr:hypothetical protein SNEBB_001857 [Seison nebaliae]